MALCYASASAAVTVRCMGEPDEEPSDVVWSLRSLSFLVTREAFGARHSMSGSVRAMPHGPTAT
jgi:hypothetical protein